MAAPDKANSPTAQARPEWAKARRIVVKIGSSLLVDRASGQLKSAWLDTLADDVAGLVKAGKEVIVVSSGAIALGRHVLALRQGARWRSSNRRRPPPSARSRSPAPTRPCSRRAGSTAAQILLTLGDTEERRRYLNARQTIDTLLGRARRAGRQRERHGGHRRDPLRRQRPPVGARRQHDERRLPGAAVRRRRPLHRAARQRRRRAR